MNSNSESISKPPLRRRLYRALKRIVLSVLATAGGYLLLAAIGLLPVNNDFRPTENEVEIFVMSNEVHADLILPIQNSVIDWREHFPESEFNSPTSWATHLAFGWGDRGFYLYTPTWSDLKVSTAAYALFLPSNTVMHVACVHKDNLPTSCRKIKISKQQYKRIVQYVWDSFDRSDDETFHDIRIPETTYGDYDAFYSGRGTYHCFNTCNCWVGGGLRVGGVKCGWFTPLPKSVFVHLPENED